MDKEQVVQYEPVFDMVFKTYAPQKSWSLITLTHGEFSWKHAKEGYDEQDSCEVESKPPIQRKVGWMKNIIFATVLKFT